MVTEVSHRGQKGISTLVQKPLFSQTYHKEKSNKKSNKKILIKYF